MTSTLDTKTGIEKKLPIEITSTGREKAVSKEIQQITAEQLSEYIIIGAEVEGSRKVMEVVTETKGDQGSGRSNRKQIIQQQIAHVQQMSQSQLVSGIKKELDHEIRRLQQQARHIQRSLSQFSPYELNSVLAKIRALREQMMGLIRLALESLRELYITIVLKLRIVHV